ncbi:MAG: diguanylate cyclase [Pedosphaera sp.]|nr:diguanylate cyclase [Pedosphaera sp.]
MFNANDVSQAAGIFLLCGVIPVWIVAGLADYFCHRYSRISETSGTRESALHLVQFCLIGLPIVSALFLQINAGIFLLAAICILLHHAVAYVDVAYANHTRKVTPVEQMVHSFLEILPIVAFLLAGILYWPQLLSLLGLGSQTAHFRPEPRVLPPTWIACVLGAAFFLNALPYMEELLRCTRRRGGPHG